MPQPLPIIPPLAIQGDPTGVSAYETCLRIEGNLQPACNNAKQNHLVHIRVLGYLLHYSPSNQGLSKVILEITSMGDDDDAVLQLGKMYHDGLIMACKFFSLFIYLYGIWCSHSVGCTKSIPKGYVRASARSKFNTVVDMIKASLNEDPKDPKKLVVHVLF